MKAQYYWKLKNRRGMFTGYVDGVDMRDAVSRVLTQSVAFTEKLFGQIHNIPLEVLDRAPGNLSASYEHKDETFTIEFLRLSRLTCPTASNGASSLIGCGSTNVSEPDDEGFHDCGDCGLFFKRLVAA